MHKIINEEDKSAKQLLYHAFKGAFITIKETAVFFFSIILSLQNLCLYFLSWYDSLYIRVTDNQARDNLMPLGKLQHLFEFSAQLGQQAK